LYERTLCAITLDAPQISQTKLIRSEDRTHHPLKPQDFATILSQRQ